MKNQKGITLVALVITIVVLLILAGVTISMVMGDNGVLSNSSKAKKDSATGSANDALSAALSSISTNYYASSTGEGADSSISTAQKELNKLTNLSDVLTSDYFKEELQNQMPGYTINSAGATVKFSEKNGKYSFTATITNTLTVNTFKNDAD